MNHGDLSQKIMQIFFLQNGVIGDFLRGNPNIVPGKKLLRFRGRLSATAMIMPVDFRHAILLSRSPKLIT